MTPPPPPPPPPLVLVAPASAVGAAASSAALLEIEARRRTAAAVAVEIETVDGRLRSIVHDPGWRGPAARAFVDAVERLRPTVRTAGDHVATLALALEGAAARLRQPGAFGEP